MKDGFSYLFRWIIYFLNSDYTNKESLKEEGERELKWRDSNIHHHTKPYKALSGDPILTLSLSLSHFNIFFFSKKIQRRKKRGGSSSSNHQSIKFNIFISTRSISFLSSHSSLINALIFPVKQLIPFYKNYDEITFSNLICFPK